jgi:hypothetical protein
VTAGKPLHRFALVLWALAAIYLVVIPPISWSLYRDAADAARLVNHPGAGSAMINAAWRSFTDGLSTATELTAAGFVIELLDSIRWHLTPLHERVSRRLRSSANANME